ncbi:MAG: alkaline phosphatase family protein [Anaerolineae bacterium]|nr:alkaline phosphatase family protein [Anaerolineae bacterium]
MTAALAADLEQTILAHRPLDADVPWAGEIVFPYYAGLSIRNLAHTVVRLIGGAAANGRLGQSPLDARLWTPLDDRVRRAVLFITDGLGWRLLQEIMAEDAAVAQTVADLVGEGTLTPLTSIAPSTTAAALPAIWSGAGPAATGMVGTRLLLREFGVLASLLHFRPLSGRHRSEVLEEWGLDFETFLPVETVSEVLDARAIPTYALLQKDLYGSGLSRVMHRGVKRAVRHYGYTDLWIELRNLLHATRRNRCFISVYWGAVDGVSHLFGTVTEQAIAEARSQLRDLRDVLLGPGVGDRRTLFMLVADHGHSPVRERIDLSAHPPLAEALRCGPGGEGRFAYLYLRHDYRTSVRDYVREHLGDRLATFDPAEALRAGLFGPEAPHTETGPRLGDLTLVAREGVVIQEGPRAGFVSASRHGGLSAREMLVPLVMRMM